MINRIKKYFSVPLVIYLVVFLACIIMILPNIFVDSENKPRVIEILANIGYSLFASDVAGILFDLGNNISHEKQNQKQYNAITYSHCNMLNDLIAIVDDICENLDIVDYQDMTLVEQLNSILFKGQTESVISSKEYSETTEDISYWLDMLKKESEKLLDISYIMYENDNFSEKKRMHLRFLSVMTAEAIKLFDMHTIQSHKKVSVLINDRIIKQMLALYPEQKTLFDDYT